MPTTTDDMAAYWIKDLDSDEFSVRTASRDLKQLGEAVVTALRQAKNGKPSAEQRRRLDELLEDSMDAVPGPDQLRSMRALAALQHIGGPKARKVVAALAAGAEGARLTREAKLALERLKRTEK